MINKLKFLLFISSLFFSACNKTPGEKIFKDRKFANNKKIVSCSYCHSGGTKLDGVATQSTFDIDGVTYNSIENVINQVMIKQFMQGDPIDINSQQMKDLVAYIKKISIK
ncbi:MAG: hypothetical protein HOD92_03100 [Deltaproteobacteria bacterium]|nr:hypothetical protein [Deltaproteobacteria bacterium]MBT4527639.1 hypothetical protein [Deltaproteobacteria bacterium]